MVEKEICEAWKTTHAFEGVLRAAPSQVLVPSGLRDGSNHSLHAVDGAQ
jgi:hypothetical protein